MSTSSSQISSALANVVALVEKIRFDLKSLEADAYKRGCDDTLSRILNAAQAAPALTEADRARAIEPVRDSLPAKIDYSWNAETPKKRAPKGSVPRYVNQVLTEPAYSGLDYQGIWRRVRDLGGTQIALASIRNYLRHLELKELANRQNEIWYPSPNLKGMIDQIASVSKSHPADIFEEGETK